MSADDKIAQLFSGFSEGLDNLSTELKSQLKELVFSIRQNVLSVCAVFSDKEPIEKLIGFNIPKEILDLKPGKLGVDLDSIGTDRLRLYASNTDDGVEVYGYYLKDNSIYEKKIYTEVKVPGAPYISIDRFDADGKIISENEVELIGDESYWVGSRDLIDIARENNYRCVFFKKKEKDQCYVRIVKRLD